MDNFMSILALVLAFVVILVLILKFNWTIMTAAIPASMVLILFDGINLWTGLKDYFSAGVGSAVTSYFLLMVVSSIFGFMMNYSGCALKIATLLVHWIGKKRFAITLHIIAALMVYGGINAMVVVFTVGPIGLAMAKEVNCSRKMCYAAIMGGAGSYAMAALPGTPSMINLIPTTFLGTTATAAPILSVITCVLQFALSVLFLILYEKRLAKKGEGFETVEGSVVRSVEDFGESGLPHGIIAFLPIIVLIGFVILLSDYVGGSLAAAIFGGAIGCVIIFVTNRSRFKSANITVGSTVVKGASEGVIVAVSVGAAVGFGEVVKHSSVFALITGVVSNMSSSGTFGTLAAVWFGVSLFVGSTAGAAGGLQTFWQTMGDHFIRTGVNVEQMHRISTIAASGFDSMPHNPSYPLFDRVLGTRYRDTYPLAAMTTLVIPTIGCWVTILLASLGIV